MSNAKMRHFRAHGGGLQYGFVFLCIAFSVDVMDVTRAHSVLSPHFLKPQIHYFQWQCESPVSLVRSNLTMLGSLEPCRWRSIGDQVMKGPGIAQYAHKSKSLIQDHNSRQCFEVNSAV